MQIIIEWASHKIEKLLKLGFLHSNIIIDPGIGFGKSVYQNIEILKNIDMLKTLNVQILIGHSRKGYINAFSRQKPANMDIETIAISSRIMHKVDFLRVHNILDHMRFFCAYKIFE
jgi:2-amino-4-hydroxy-6-hydroxymethyldihydropteridine diphosphokinase/dihydropteroate synthase